VWEVTNPGLSIVRLHGRNQATWNRKGLSSSAERFNYDYNEVELESLGKRIAAIPAATVHVVFNNNFETRAAQRANAHHHADGLIVKIANVLSSVLSARFQQISVGSRK
jgi:uncharacterized protein YecE (DUF72 family)